MKPFISIVIPTLNEEDYLPKLLQDMVRQVDKSFEIVIVDGYSNDKTKEKAESFQDILNVRFYGVKRRNLSYQRNFGAEKAQGKYLIFLDADIRVTSTFIKNFSKEIHRSKYLIYMPYLLPDGGTNTEKMLFKISNFFVEVSQNSPSPFVTGGVIIFQKNVFKFLGGFKERLEHDMKDFYPEDQDIVMRASKQGIKARFVKGVKVKFSLRRMKKEGTYNVVKKYVEVGLDMVFKGELQKRLNYEMGGHLYKKENYNKKKSMVKK